MGIFFILAIPILVAVLIFRLKKWSIIKKIVITLIFIIIYGALLGYWLFLDAERRRGEKVINKVEIINNE